MVQEGARARFDIPHIPLSACAPELAVPAGYNFRFKAYGHYIWVCLAIEIPFAVTADADYGLWSFECAGNS